MRLCFISILRTSQEAVTCRQQHTSPLRGPDKRGLSGRVFHMWDLSRGFRHAGLLLVEEPTSLHQSPSFLRVSLLSTNRLTDGFSAKFYLPCVQRSITVGDWRALKNTFSSCFFVIAFQVNHLTGLFYQTKPLFSKLPYGLTGFTFKTKRPAA